MFAEIGDLGLDVLFRTAVGIATDFDVAASGAGAGAGAWQRCRESAQAAIFRIGCACRHYCLLILLHTNKQIHVRVLNLGTV